MGKKKHFRRWASMILAVMLLFNQIPIAAVDSESVYAREGNEKTTEQITEESAAAALEDADAILSAKNADAVSDADEIIADVTADDMQEEASGDIEGTQELISSTGTAENPDEGDIVIDNTSDWEISAAEEGQILPVYSQDVSTLSLTEADAGISLTQIAVNHYELHIKWQVSGAQEEIVTLALGMDEMIYDSLPESVKADEDGICRITAENGEALLMGKETDEDGARILLVYEQNGDGELSLDLALSNENITEEHNSIITAQWLGEDGAWIVADQAEVPWLAAAVASPETETEAEAESESEEEETTETISEPETETEEDSDTETTSEPEAESEIEGKLASETDSEMETELFTEITTEPETEEYSQYAAAATAEAEGTPGIAASSEIRRSKFISIAADSIDMSDYITSAEFTPSEIEEGELVQLSIGYKIQSVELTNAGTNKLTYQLPEGIAPFETAAGTVYNKNREAVGTYEITASGGITITFNDAFVLSGNSITGEIHFWTLLSAQGDGEEHEYQFSVSNQITAKIKIKEVQTESNGETEQKTDLYVKKEETSFDEDTQKASYKITIGTNYGTKDNISFNDDFSEAKDSFGNQVTGTISETGTIVKIDQDGNSGELNFDDYFDTANGDITLKEGVKLPLLKAGEKYVITYDMQFEGIDEMNGDVSLSNTVAVSDGRSYPSDRADISFNHTYIKKSSAYDSKTDKISWQIEINDFGADLNGMTLSDVLKRNDVEVGLPNTVTMLEYLDDGSVEETMISIPFTFSKDTVNGTTHKFVVKYTTDVSQDGFYTEYSNTAAIDDYTSGEIGQNIKHDSGVLAKNYVEPETADELQKEQVDDTTRSYLWNVVITPPADGIKAGAYYLDTMSAANHLNQGENEVHYITSEQLKAMTVKYQDETKRDVPESVYEKQIKVDGNWVAYTGEKEGPFSEFRIYFKEDVNVGEAIVLSYRTTAELADMLEGAVWTFTNSGTFFQDKGSTNDSDSTKESKGGYLKKVGMFLNSAGEVELGGEGSTKVYDECKGILYYNITVNETQSMKYGDGDIVVEDILPEGTTLYQGAYKINAYSTSNAINDKVVKFYWNNSQNSNMFDEASGTINSVYVSPMKIDEMASWSYDEQTRKLTIHIPQSVYGYVDASESHIVRVFYAAQITDALGKNETKEYKNNATMYLNETEKATDSVTDTVTSSYITKMYQAADAGDEASYRILVNPTGAQLAGGSTLTLVDVLDYTKHTVTYTTGGTSVTKQYINSVSLKPNSFHLYNLNADGSTGSEISTSLYTVRYGEDEAGTKYQMEIQIPDETPCVLEYTYKFSVDAAALKNAGLDSYDVVNDVNLSGSITDESGDKSEIKTQDSGASADTDSLLLTKVDEDNQVVYLKGAKFQLQKYTGLQTDEDWSADKNWQNVKIYETGEDGTASLAGLSEKTAYRLIEIEAPTNYILDETPQYFYVGTNTESFPSGFVTEAAKNKTATGAIIVTNKKSDKDYTSVSIEKIWEDAKGNLLQLEDIVDGNEKQIDHIIINLYQKTEADAEITETEEPYRTAELSHDDDNNWYYTFNNLPKTDKEGNTYYYYVRETGKAETADGTETDLTQSYEASINVTEGIRGGTLRLTNKKKAVKTEVTVTKNWAEGSVTQPVPVILYGSKTEPSGVSDKSVSVTIEMNGDYSSSCSVSEQCTVINTGTDVTLVFNCSQDIFPDTLSYQVSGSNYSVAGEKKTETINWQTRYVWTYVLTNITDDVSVQAEVSGWVDNNVAEISVFAEPVFTSGKLILPEDAEEIGRITLCSDNETSISTKENTYTWSGLLDDYYYYIQEGNDETPGYIEGYVADYGYTYWDAPDNTQIKEVTITNTPTALPTETSVTVQKKWQLKDENGEWTDVEDTSADNAQLPSSVTFKLYRSTIQNDQELTEDKLVETQNVSAANNWEYTWTGLPKTAGSDGTGDPYYYYVKEADGDLGAYTPEIDHTEGVTGGTIVVSNQITSVTAQKKWLAADGKDLAAEECPESITVQLYRADAPGYDYAITVGQQHVLNADNEWTYTWSGLPAGTYYVEEVTAPQGFITTYQNGAQTDKNETASSAALTDGTIVITNQKEAAGLAVNKKWSDEITENKPNVTVKLYRTTVEPEGVTPEDKSSNMTVSVKLNWYESDGTETTILPTEGSCQVTFTGNTTQTVTLNAQSNWEGSVTLPATASDGTVLEYTVNYDSTIQIDSEISASVTGDRTVISGNNGDQSVTLTATKKETTTSDGNRITVNVYSWNGDTNGIPCDDNSVYIDVVVGSDNRQVGVARLNKENNWSETIVDTAGISSTPYSLWSATASDNDVITEVNTYHIGNGWYPNIIGSGVLNVAVTYTETTLAAQVVEDTACLIPTSRTLTTAADTSDASEQTASGIETETLVLNIDGQEVTITDAEYMGASMNKTLNGANDWAAGWQNLDKTDKDGNLYYYYAVETPVTGYDASYKIVYMDGDAGKGIASIEITNTKNEDETTSITVQKQWSGDIIDSAKYEASFTLYDKNTEQPVDAANIEANITLTGDSSYTWQNLPLGTYYVVETSAKCDGSDLTNYSTTYLIAGGEETGDSAEASAGNGTITVTNTVTKQGIILPGTGSKYPLVFYGLGSAFLLISMIWMFLTFKKSNIPIDTGKGGRKSNK